MEECGEKFWIVVDVLRGLLHFCMEIGVDVLFFKPGLKERRGIVTVRQGFRLRTSDFGLQASDFGLQVPLFCLFLKPEVRSLKPALISQQRNLRCEKRNLFFDGCIGEATAGTPTGNSGVGGTALGFLFRWHGMTCCGSQ